MHSSSRHTTWELGLLVPRETNQKSIPISQRQSQHPRRRWMASTSAGWLLRLAKDGPQRLSSGRSFVVVPSNNNTNNGT